MKLFIFLTLFALSFASFGNYKWELERNLKLLTRQVNALAHQNADLLTVRELRNSIRTLKDAKATLLGFDRDYPSPTCSQESPQLFKNVFKSIKFFAGSVKGPELSNEDAINYAIDWTNTYPCSYSDYFQSSYLTIKRYASVSNGGIDLPNDQAIAYANEKTPKFCGDMRFKNDFWASYKLAKYEMEMSEEQAVNYAKGIVERDHFTCRWDDKLVYDNVRFINAPTVNLQDICIMPIIAPTIPVVPRTPTTPRTPRSPRSPR